MKASKQHSRSVASPQTLPSTPVMSTAANFPPSTISDCSFSPFAHRHSIGRKLTRLEFGEEQEVFRVGVELGAPFPGDEPSHSAEEDEDAEGDEAFRAFAEVLPSRGSPLCKFNQ